MNNRSNPHKHALTPDSQHSQHLQERKKIGHAKQQKLDSTKRRTLEDYQIDNLMKNVTACLSQMTEEAELSPEITNLLSAFVKLEKNFDPEYRPLIKTNFVLMIMNIDLYFNLTHLITLPLHHMYQLLLPAYHFSCQFNDDLAYNSNDMSILLKQFGLKNIPNIGALKLMLLSQTKGQLIHTNHLLFPRYSELLLQETSDKAQLLDQHEKLKEQLRSQKKEEPLTVNERTREYYKELFMRTEDRKKTLEKTATQSARLSLDSPPIRLVSEINQQLQAEERKLCFTYEENYIAPYTTLTQQVQSMQQDIKEKPATDAEYSTAVNRWELIPRDPNQESPPIITLSEATKSLLSPLGLEIKAESTDTDKPAENSLFLTNPDTPPVSPRTSRNINSFFAVTPEPQPVHTKNKRSKHKKSSPPKCTIQ